MGDKGPSHSHPLTPSPLIDVGIVDGGGGTSLYNHDGLVARHLSRYLLNLWGTKLTGERKHFHMTNIYEASKKKRQGLLHVHI